MSGETRDERQQAAREAWDVVAAASREADRARDIDHPAHYGGADNLYEAIKVIEAWRLGFNLGNTVKYICRADKKGNLLQDLEKARWYLDREIQRLQQ